LIFVSGTVGAYEVSAPFTGFARPGSSDVLTFPASFTAVTT
jgi:hypothetical protein